MTTRFKLYHGDCLEALRKLQDNSIDSIVTDPPYGLTAARPGGRSEATRGAVMGGFMGLTWDSDVPPVEVWVECLRVLKPGGHLLAFAGTRTQHRMACRIEDASFEIRDMIAWVYGSGFPKSRNLDGDWRGWGTALKPAMEPITVARKPLAGTVAANVLTHGVGALNIDACRVGNEERTYAPKGTSVNAAMIRVPEHRAGTAGAEVTVSGRWPANLIHDDSDEVVSLFPESNSSATPRNRKPKENREDWRMGGAQYNDTTEYGDKGSAARFFYCAKASRKDRHEGLTDPGPQFEHGATLRKVENTATTGNNHPTVKPTELMAYLCRLVTPPGGVVLDPFMGSGSTGKAAMREGFRFLGCELNAEYLAIATARIEHEHAKQTEGNKCSTTPRATA